MNTSESPDAGGGMRRSHKVALVLLGTAGVVGLVAIWDAWRKPSAREGAAATSLPPAEPVAADRVYANNDYVPGVGYYHAPYHAWFPHPYNFHDPSRGYFAGGLWQAMPWAAASLLSSSPNTAAVTSARAAQEAYAAQRTREEERRAQSRGFAGHTGGYTGGTSGFTSRPAGTAPASRPVIRGGFGFSSHPSGA